MSPPHDDSERAAPRYRQRAAVALDPAAPPPEGRTDGLGAAHRSLRRTRASAFVGGCLLALGVAVAVLKLAAPLYPSPPGTLAAGLYAQAKRKIAAWGAKPMPPGRVRGAVFGDSVWAPQELHDHFALTFDRALREGGFDVNLLDLTQAGFGAYQFYYLSPRVVAAGPPTFAVVEVNLFTCAPDWYGEPLGRFLPMVAELSIEQVWRVHHALATQQVGLLTPLVYRLDDRFGMLSLLDGARTLAIDRLDDVGNWGNSVFGLAVPSHRDIAGQRIRRHVQLTPETAQLWYGEDFVASPTAEVLRAFSDDMRAAGVTILYVVSPLQRQTLRRFGVLPDDLHARTERLRQMLQASPEQWLDTTDLFQTADFIDGVHVRNDLIRRFAPAVIDRLVELVPGLRASQAASSDRGNTTP